MTPHRVGCGALVLIGLVAGCGVSHPSTTNHAITAHVVTVIDHAGRSSLAVDTNSQEGRFVLRTRVGVVAGSFGIKPWTQSLSLHAAQACLQGPAPRCRYTITGKLDLGTHFADLRIQLNHPALSTLLQTAQPDLKAAIATTASALDAIRRNDIVALVGMLSPVLRGSDSAAAFAGSLSAQGIHVTRVDSIGSGRLAWLQDGVAAWETPIEVTATTPAGQRSLKVTLTLDDEEGHWYVLSAP